MADEILEGKVTLEEFANDPGFWGLSDDYAKIRALEMADPEFGNLSPEGQIKVLDDLSRKFNPTPLDQAWDFGGEVINQAIEQGTGGLVDRPDTENLGANLLGGIVGGASNELLGAGLGFAVGGPLGAYLGQGAGAGLGAFGQDIREQLDAGRDLSQVNYLRSGLQGLGAAGGALVMPGVGSVGRRAAREALAQGGIGAATDLATQLADTGKVDLAQTAAATGFGLGLGAAGGAIGGQTRSADYAGGLRQRLKSVVDFQQANFNKQKPVGLAGLQKGQPIVLPSEALQSTQARILAQNQAALGPQTLADSLPVQTPVQAVQKVSASILPEGQAQQNWGRFVPEIDDPNLDPLLEQLAARQLMEENLMLAARQRAEAEIQDAYLQAINALENNQNMQVKFYRDELKTRMGKRNLPEIRQQAAAYIDDLDQAKEAFRIARQQTAKQQPKPAKAPQFEPSAILEQEPAKPKLTSRKELKALQEDVRTHFQKGSPAGEQAAYEVLGELGYTVKPVKTKKGKGYRVRFMGKGRTIEEGQSIGSFLDDMSKKGQDPYQAVAKQAQRQGTQDTITNAKRTNLEEGAISRGEQYSDDLAELQAKQQEAELEQAAVAKQQEATAEAQKILEELDVATTQKEIDALEARAERLGDAVPDEYWSTYTRKLEQATLGVEPDKPQAKPKKQLMPKARKQQIESKLGGRKLSEVQADLKRLEEVGPRKRTGEAKEIKDRLRDVDPSLKDVLKAEPDFKTGKAKQSEVSPQAQTFQTVKNSIAKPLQSMARKIDQAMKNGQRIPIRYEAEVSGSRGRGVELQGADNYVAEEGLFTPVNWSETKKGEVVLQGYNQDGHFRSYHLDKAYQKGKPVMGLNELRSKINTVGEPEAGAFNGPVPNVYKGAGTFDIDPYLARIPDEGLALKTSESAAMLKKILSDNQDIDLKRLNPKLVEALSLSTSDPAVFEGKVKWSEIEAILDSDKKTLEQICSILGVK